jgi:hypothetical protein
MKVVVDQLIQSWELSDKFGATFCHLPQPIVCMHPRVLEENATVPNPSAY